MFKSPLFLHNATSEGSGGEVIKTKEQIDKQNEFRKTQGLEPIPYPTEASSQQPTNTDNQSGLDKFRSDKEAELKASNSGMTEEDIRNEAEKLVRAEAERIKQEQELLAEEARKNAGDRQDPVLVKILAKETKKEQKNNEQDNVDEDDIDETLILKHLSKKTGKTISSLDEILNPEKEPTPEEKEAKIQERENNKVAFALQNNLISKQEIENFIADTKNPEDVAFSFYAAQQKEIDPSLTDKEIRDQFEEEYGLNEDSESRRYKSGQAQINFIANSIIQKKHSKYLQLDGVYSKYEESQIQDIQLRQKIEQLTPHYKKDVDAVLNSIKKFNLGGYEVELDNSIIDSYRADMLNPQYSNQLIQQGWTLEQLETATKKHAIYENLDGLIDGILKADRLKNQAGQRGIIPPQNKVPQKLLNEVQNEERRKLQERLGMQHN